jgi:hypothetical protein
MLCCYTECHILFIIMLNINMLSVVMLNVVTPTFFSGRSLQSCLMFVSKAVAGAYPGCSLKVLTSTAGSWPYSETLYYAEEACQG